MTTLNSNPEPAFLASMGERIKAIRRNWKWSQVDLARALKVDQASISFWETDKVRPNGAALVALASIFRTQVDALLVGADFAMPEAPSAAEQANLKTGELRTVSLPYAPGGELMVVDLGDGSAKGLNLPDAMVRLSEGVAGNRKVWVVLA